MTSRFDMKFHDVLVGWEGSAIGAIMLFSALDIIDGFSVPDGNETIEILLCLV